MDSFLNNVVISYISMAKKFLTPDTETNYAHFIIYKKRNTSSFLWKLPNCPQYFQRILLAEPEIVNILNGRVLLIGVIL